MKKHIIGFLCLVLAIAVCLPLVACAGQGSSSTDESDALKAQIESTLSQLQACEGEPFELAQQAVAGYGDTLQSHLDWLGITDAELVRAYLDGFTYEVGEVSVTGASAQARLTLRLRSATGIAKSYLTSGRVNEAEGKQALLDAISQASAEDSDVTLYISKNDAGEWDVMSALSSTLGRACL